MEGLANTFERRRPAVAALLAVITAVALFGLTRATYDDVPRSMFRADDEDFARLDEVFAEFGTDDNDCLIVLEADDWFRPGAIEALRAIVADARAVDGVEGVTSLLDLPAADLASGPRMLIPPGPLETLGQDDWDALRRAALAHPLAGGHLLSADGQTTLVVARLAGTDLPIEELAPPVRALEAAARARAGAAGLRARQTGIPALRVQIFESLPREALRIDLLAAIAGFAIAWWSFRRPGPVLLACSGPMLGALWTAGAFGLVGLPFDLLNTYVPAIAMVIGFTDAMHLVIDVRRSQEAGLAPLRAARDAIRHLTLPCGLTSLTTAVGFGSLAVARVDGIRNFGIGASVGVVLTFAAVILTVPLAASTLQLDGPRHEERLSGPWAGGVERLVLARPGLVATFGSLVTAGLVVLCFGLRPENRLSEATPRDEESVQALMHVDRVLGGTLPVLVLVEWEPELEFASPDVQGALREVADWIEADPLTSAPLSALDLLALIGDGAPPAAIGLVPEDVRARFLRLDQRRALIRARAPDAGSDRFGPMVDALRAELVAVEAAHPGVHLALTGTGVVADENLNRMIGDLARGLGLAAVVIFGVMTLALRSIRLGLVSVVPNVLPLAAVGASLVIAGVPLQMSSAIVFTICLGIAVDDTIHVLVRFQRERATGGGDPREAVRRTMRAVAPALVITTAVLVAGFGCLLVADIPTFRSFGALGVLGFLVAIVGDLVFLPALLVRTSRGSTP